MKKKDARIDLALSIGWALLGIIFLYQGIKVTGLGRAVFLLFGCIDILYAVKLLRGYLCNRDKK